MGSAARWIARRRPRRRPARGPWKAWPTAWVTSGGRAARLAVPAPAVALGEALGSGPSEWSSIGAAQNVKTCGIL